MHRINNLVPMPISLQDFNILSIVFWTISLGVIIVLLVVLIRIMFLLQRLLQVLPSLGLRPLSLQSRYKPMEDPVNTQQEIARFARCEAFCYGRQLHAYEDIKDGKKDEDRFYVGLLGETFPVVIIADGVTTSKEDLITGEVQTGMGAIAAERARDIARAYLDKELPNSKSIEEVLGCLHDMYPGVVRGLNETLGQTTLLVALLWESPKNKTLYWCYAYEGDGSITLLSPKRKIENKVLPDKLLSPQKVERTANVQRAGFTVPPVVGCRLYEQDDVVYVATDGLHVGSLDKWLRTSSQYNTVFHEFFLSQVSSPDELARVLSSYPNYGDDAVIGVIRTEGAP